MAALGIVMRPLAVASRGALGAFALFECILDSSPEQEVSVWATCGQRRRVPAKAGIVSDSDVGRSGQESRASSRRLLASVFLPAGYAACTLHLRVGTGLAARRASCRIDEQKFRQLVAARGSAEDDDGYHGWMMAHRPGDEELAEERRRADAFERTPLISIVTPVFRTPEDYLRQYLESLLAQTYGCFEVVIVNVSGPCEEVDRVLSSVTDERVRIIEAPNRTISENTNVGIGAARGDYVAFVDHDDFVEPDALFRYVEALNECPEADLLYCDEDHWGDPDGRGARFFGVRFKPAWNPDLLFTHNYVCHLLMVSRRVLDLTERSGPEVNGAQDLDLTLKAAEVSRAIYHVPHVLYHWRHHAGSTALNRRSKPYALEAGRLAVQGHFDRLGIDAEVVEGSYPFSYRVRYRRDRGQTVSVIVFDSGAGAAAGDGDAAPAEVGSGPACTSLGEVEVMCAVPGRPLAEAIRAAHGRIVVLLDAGADIEGEAWLDEIVRPLARPDAGCCAPVLLDADGFVVSAGLYPASDGSWQPALRGYWREDIGYMTMLEHARDVDAVSLACLAFRKADFERLGGFEGIPDDAAAIDFCARLREAGLFAIVQPYAPIALAQGDASSSTEGFKP